MPSKKLYIRDWSGQVGDFVIPYPLSALDTCEIMIGRKRSPMMDGVEHFPLLIDVASVSEQHAVVDVYHTGRHLVTALSTTNGTYVGQLRTKEQSTIDTDDLHELKTYACEQLTDGTILCLGDPRAKNPRSVCLVFEMPK